MTIEQLINNVYEKLSSTQNSSYNADSVAKQLVGHFLNMDIVKLYQNKQNKIDNNLDVLWTIVQEYINGKPLQYITNSQYFYGYDFYVDNRVLIPRYETEELVDKVSEIIDSSNKENLKIADIGTGSGAIAISLALENPHHQVYATDISSQALEVAKINAKNLNCKNVSFFQGDILKPLIENNIRIDILVFNPPYISKQEAISNRVKDFEPAVALYGENNGCYFYEEIFKSYSKVLNDKGFLCFEIGYTQKRELTKLIHKYFNNNIKYDFIKDINKKWRILIIEIL